MTGEEAEEVVNSATTNEEPEEIECPACGMMKLGGEYCLYCDGKDYRGL